MVPENSVQSRSIFTIRTDHSNKAFIWLVIVNGEDLKYTLHRVVPAFWHVCFSPWRLAAILDWSMSESMR